MPSGSPTGSGARRPTHHPPPPPATPSSRLTQHRGDRALQARKGLRPLSLLDRIGNAALDVTFQQLHGRGVDRLLDGAELDQDVLARLVLSDEPLHTAHVALDPLQAVDALALTNGVPADIGQTKLGHMGSSLARG